LVNYNSKVTIYDININTDIQYIYYQ